MGRESAVWELDRWVFGRRQPTERAECVCTSGCAGEWNMVHPHIHGEERSAHQPRGEGLQGDSHYIPVKVYVCTLMLYTNVYVNVCKIQMHLVENNLYGIFDNVLHGLLVYVWLASFLSGFQ